MKHTLLSLLFFGLIGFSPVRAQIPKDPDSPGDTTITKPEVPNVIQAQSAFPVVIPSSPNVASLGKYMDIPVSYYTGTPSISVPLYVVKNADLELPLSLFYHGSGIRVEEEASQVGLGWALQAGGVIRRQIRGRDDLKSDGNAWRRLVELSSSVGSGLCINLSQGSYRIFTANSIGGTATAAGIELAGILSDMTVISSFEPSTDTELDLFSYDVGGYSGKFVIEPIAAGQFAARSLTKDAVKITITGAVPAQWNFILTLPDGSEYTFDQKEIQKVIDPGIKKTIKYQNAVEYGGLLYTSAAVEHVNAWYLTKIRSANRAANDVISISYFTGGYIGQLPTGTETFYSTNNGADSDPSFRWRVSEVLSQEILPDEITFTNGKVKFFRSAREDRPAGSLKLDRIEIQTPGGSVIKTLAFAYEYFNSNSNAPDIVRKRLKLLNVREKSGANLLPGYQFTYNTATNLPDKNSYQQDYWGYFNGATVNDTRNTMLPSDQVVAGAQFKLPASLLTGATRNANTAFVTANLLTDVTYPTGGKTTYTWEANTFTNAHIQNAIAPVLAVQDFIGNPEIIGGGTRIKKIEHKEVNGNVQKQSQFEYQDPGTSQKSGKLMAPLTFMEWVDGGVLYSSACRHPMGASAQGNPVGYNTVATFDGATRLEEGYSVFNYENKVELADNTTFCMTWGQGGQAPACAVQPSLWSVGSFNCSAYSGPVNLNKSVTESGMPNMVHYLNGSILAELHYNSQNKPVRSVAFAYESTVDKLVKGFKVKTTDGFTFGLSYQIESVWNRLREKKELTYDEDGDPSHFTETISEFTYNNTYLQPTKMVTTDSKGGTSKVQVGQSQVYPRQIETLFKYPFDLADGVSTAMTTKNMISVPAETTKRLAVVTGNAQIFTPLHWAKTAYALTQGIFYLPQLVQSKLGAAPSPVTDMQFLSYDNRGNLLTFQDNAGSVTKLEYFGAADLGKTDWVKSSTTSEGTSSAHTASYNFKPAIGIEQIQDPNAKAVFYEYDGYLRLKSSRSGNAAGALRISYCYNFAGQVVECPPVPVTGVSSPPPLALIGEEALPVTLLTFEATPKERAVLLNWSTSSETNSSHFAIERSADGKRWQELGTIPAQVESDSSWSYTFIDIEPRSGENLYRLRMVDLDSTFAFSRIRSVFFDTNGEIVLFPNPLTLGSELRIQTSDPSNIRQVQLIDTGGKQVLVTPWKNAIPVGNIAAGLYLVKIIYADGSVSYHRIVKQ